MHLFKFITLVIGILLLVCCNSTDDDSSCHTSEKSTYTTLRFEKNALLNFFFPEDYENLMGISVRNQKSSIEIYNLETMKALDNPTELYNRMNRSNHYFDREDSIIWHGGMGHKLKLTDLKSKESRKFNIIHVSDIIPFERKVFFNNGKAIYVVDEHNMTPKRIFKNDKNHLIKILRVKDQIIINHQKVLDLKTAKIADFEPNSKLAKYASLAKKGFSQYPINARLLETDSAYQAIVLNNVDNHRKDTLSFLLPKGPQSLDIRIDQDKTWLTRSNLLAYVSHNDNNTYLYSKSAGFKKFIIDDCNIYLLYQDSISIISKEKILDDFIYFDDRKYIDDLEEFKSYRKEQLKNITTEEDAIITLNKINQRYADYDHIEIREELKELETQAFSLFSYDGDQEYMRCIFNERLPLTHKKSQFSEYIRDLIRGQRYEKLLTVGHEFKEHLLTHGDSSNDIFYDYDKIASVFHRVDSINLLSINEDEKQYHSTLAYEEICYTTPYTYEGCGGNNYDLFKDLLLGFLIANWQTMLSTKSIERILVEQTNYLKNI